MLEQKAFRCHRTHRKTTERLECGGEKVPWHRHREAQHQLRIGKVLEKTQKTRVELYQMETAFKTRF